MSYRQVPLLNLHALHAGVRTEILAAWERVFDSQAFILGEEVRQFESEIAAYCQAPHALGCASGTDALILALRAAGVGPGDAVLTTPFSFFASASAIHLVGARPVFADIDPATYTLCPQAAAQPQPEDVKAIIPVHLYGGCADMELLLSLAEGRGWTVIEDAAQAIGATCGRPGRPAASMGEFGCLSFFPSKNLGGLGDGGLVTARSHSGAQSLAMLRVHGSREKYVHELVGYNSRLDSLQAAALRVKLRYLDQETAGRQENAARYGRLLTGVEGVRAPRPGAWQSRHVYNQFVIAAARRDELKRYLAGRGIGTEVYYPVPLHLQPCFAGLGYRAGDFPVSEKAAAEVLALPVHSALSVEDVEFVAGAIRDFYDGK